MKIAYIMTQSYDIGGASVHVIDMAAAMQAAGHEVVVLVGGNGIFHQRARALSLRTLALRHLVREINPLQDALVIGELLRILRVESPDLVHLHSTKAGIVGRLAAWANSTPVVFTVHGWAFTEGVPARKAFLYRWIERVMAPLANRIITVSDYDRNLALRQGVGRSEQLVTVHNGMPDDAPLAVFQPGDTPEIIMVARMDPPKNHRALLTALHALMDRPWRLTLVGDGALRAAIEAQAMELGLTSRIRFLGECHDVAERLAAADLFVLTSDWEALPLSIIEAMRAGLPVVASRVGGVPEVVANGLTGHLVSRDDVYGLVCVLRELLASAPGRRQMGRAGRERYLSDFHFRTMFDKTLSVYRAAMGQG